MPFFSLNVLYVYMTKAQDHTELVDLYVDHFIDHFLEEDAKKSGERAKRLFSVMDVLFRALRDHGEQYAKLHFSVDQGAGEQVDKPFDNRQANNSTDTIGLLNQSTNGVRRNASKTSGARRSDKSRHRSRNGSTRSTDKRTTPASSEVRLKMKSSKRSTLV